MEGVKGGRGHMYTCGWDILILWLKPTQDCKVIILQFKKWKETRCSKHKIKDYWERQTRLPFYHRKNISGVNRTFTAMSTSEQALNNLDWYSYNNIIGYKNLPFFSLKIVKTETLRIYYLMSIKMINISFNTFCFIKEGIKYSIIHI